PGVIKVIYKKNGEAVKSLEPVFQIHNHERLRVEAQVDVQYLDLLREGMSVVIEGSQAESPFFSRTVHMAAITCVAVGQSPNENDSVAAASEAGTVRLWERPDTWREPRILRHPKPVRAVACTPPASETRYLLTGAADGIARLWNLDKDPTKPEYELKDVHHNA